MAVSRGLKSLQKGRGTSSPAIVSQRLQRRDSLGEQDAGHQRERQRGEEGEEGEGLKGRRAATSSTSGKRSADPLASETLSLRDTGQ